MIIIILIILIISFKVLESKLIVFLMWVAVIEYVGVHRH